MARGNVEEDRRIYSIVGAFYEVYNRLGYGFMQYVYMLALERELRERGHRVRREVPVTILYRNVALCTQRLDLLVDESIVVEGKATQELHRSAAQKVFNYLRATSLQVGILLHFGPGPRYQIIRMRSAGAQSMKEQKSNCTRE